jgi:hypothetical protein
MWVSLLLRLGAVCKLSTGFFLANFFYFSVYLFILLLGIPLLSGYFYDCLNLIVPRIPIKAKYFSDIEKILFIKLFY